MNNERLQKDIAEFAAAFPLAAQFKGKTFAITGATGLLGSCMVRCLLELNRQKNLGITVLAVVRSKEKAAKMFGTENEKLVFHCHDFEQDEPFCPPFKVDYVAHFAAPTASHTFVQQPVETMNTVYLGTKHLLEYARKAQVESFVLASTLEVYGTILDDSQPITEDMQGFLNPMDTRSSYPMAKRAAEALCHNYAIEYGVPAKVARLAQTFGAGVAANDNRVFAQFARSVVQNTNIELHTTGELSRCYCYTTDAIGGMLHVLVRGTNGEAYNIANESTYISIKNMAEMVADTFNPNIKVAVKLQEGMGYSPTTKLRLSAKRAEALGWKPQIDLQEMFNRLIISMKQNRE